MKNRRGITAAFVLLLGLVRPCSAGTPSDADVLRSLADSLFDSVIGEAGLVSASSVTVVSDSAASHPLFATSINSALFRNQLRSMTDRSMADVMFTVSVRNVSIAYSGTFSESFFGSLYTVRTVSMTVDAVLTDSSQVIWSGTRERSISDTVRYSSVDDLRAKNFPYAIYRPPSLSFFDSILEPVLITVASGIAMYLFFTIRS